MSEDQRIDLVFVFACLGVAIWFLCSRHEGLKMPNVQDSGDAVYELMRERQEQEYEDLLYVLPADFPMEGYCRSSRGNEPGYRDWERSVHRYVVRTFRWGGVHFSDGERDSFGPLSRIMTCVDNEGNRRRFIYG